MNRKKFLQHLFVFKFLQLLILGFALVLVSACGSKSQDQSYVETCESRSVRGYDVSWCHEYLPNSESKEVIFYFHGIGASASSWKTSALRKSVRGKNLVSTPHVISISFGERWFLSDVSIVRASRLEVLTEDLLPLFYKILGFKPLKQIAAGESMGGYNALQLAHAKPNEIDRAVLLCPAIIDFSPFWSPWKQNEYLEKHPHMDGWMLRKLSLFALYEFPTPWDWDRNNPLIQAQKSKYQLPPVFMTANKSDQYGFYDGTEKFAKLLNQQGTPSTFIFEKGSHCQHEPNVYRKIVNFLNQ